MAESEGTVKLKRGTAVKIARKLQLSVNHVSKSIKGERIPGAELAREIEKERQRQSKHAA